MANETSRFSNVHADHGARHDAAQSSAHRAALEALFAPKSPPPRPPPPARAKRDSAKMMTVPSRAPDARAGERDALLERVHSASSRGDVSRAIDAMRVAGFELPEDQESQLQALEHVDEERAREAMLVLARLVTREALKRRAVLESRLRRIEDCADEAATRELAASVRRQVARVRSS